MEFLLIQGDKHFLYWSLDTLCEENGLDKKKIRKNMLPANTPKGVILGLIPNTKA